MAKIKYIRRIDEGVITKGTNFVKGDYIPLIRRYYAYLNNGKIMELSRGVIKKMIKDVTGKDVQRITEQMLEKLKGANIGK